MNDDDLKPDIAGVEDVDAQLRTDSYLWGALRKHGRERRMEAELLTEIDDLLDLRLNITSGKKEDESCEGC
jgi:hypothetical protein